MKKEYLEPEEQDIDNKEDEWSESYNPLDEPVIEKKYSKPNVKVSAKDLQGDIPEPDFNPPPLNQEDNEQKKKAQNKEPFNPELNEIPKKDQKDAAEKVSKVIIGAYKWVNDIADKSLLIGDKKLKKLSAEGKIELDVEIPISRTQSLSASEFIEEYNDQTKGTITVSKEFEDEVTPVLTRVLQKKGIGMTDENYLLYLFGKDIAVKGFLVSQALSVKRDTLKMIMELTDERRGGSQPQAASQPRPTPPPPPENTYAETEEVYTNVEPEEQQYEEPYDELNVNNIVNEMVGAKEKPSKSNQSSIINSRPKRGRPKKK